MTDPLASLFGDLSLPDPDGGAAGGEAGRSTAGVGAEREPLLAGVYQVASVAFPMGLPEPFDYLAPEHLALGVGDHVTAPLGGRAARGVVWALATVEHCPDVECDQGELGRGDVVDRGAVDGVGAVDAGALGGLEDVDAPRVRDLYRLKTIEERLPAPALPPETVAFIDWTARYTCAPLGATLRLALRGASAWKPARTETVYGIPVSDGGTDQDPTQRDHNNDEGAAATALSRFHASKELDPELRSQVPAPTQREHQKRTRMTPARQAVLDVLLAADGPLTAGQLKAQAGVGIGVVKGLVEAGLVEARLREVKAGCAPPDFDKPGRELTPIQVEAAEDLVALVEMTNEAAREDRASDIPNVALLDGVTGSGKTEVYCEAIAAALREDPTAQVLVLLPEIALTQAILSRFEDRFGAKPAEWHSGIADGPRRLLWRAVAQGEARIVVGARSALFLPFKNLRLIVVDEEHDGSYKQDDGVMYQARDLTVVRAQISKASVILASATPSIESLVNAQRGRYAHVVLPGRPGASVLPDVETIDLRQHRPATDHWLSAPLVEAVEDTVGRGEQALLFLNRRGYAPLVICRACGHRMKAPDTDSWLVEHRYTGRLVCHATGFSIPKPKRCPECQAEDALHAVGPGVERLEEEARALFPGLRIDVFSSDTARDAKGVEAKVSAMAAGEIDILVGTQIVAKGHNFPNLTLVGVIDADLGLRGGDLRAGERTYQTLVQVAGRAGRAEKPGRALLQTCMPEHEAMAALVAGDRNAFLASEIDSRKVLGMPPYGRLAAVILSGQDEEKLDRFAKDMARAAPLSDHVDVMGPTVAPIAMVRGRHRRRFLVRSERSVDISAFMAAWRGRLKVPSSIRLNIDIEPYSFL